jgi:inward rectifier potassium channel
MRHKNHPEPHAKPTMRMLMRTGEFNIDRKFKRPLAKDFYHSMLTLQWSSFFFWICVAYLITNLFFAVLYVCCAPSELAGAAQRGLPRFIDCFFFSVQTFATIGYGVIHPAGFVANAVVTAESLMSLLSIGLVTGLLFARFSRPTARVVFSNKAIITRHEGTPSLIFRMGNARFNQILEAKVTVSLARNEETLEGERYRTFSDLTLERNTNPIFALTWTVVHAIDDRSPLHGMNHDKLVESEAEILVSVVGIDDTFSQTIYSRFSYTADELVWERRFKDILSRASDGRIQVNLDGIHDLID